MMFHSVGWAVAACMRTGLVLFLLAGVLVPVGAASAASSMAPPRLSSDAAGAVYRYGVAAVNADGDAGPQATGTVEVPAAAKDDTDAGMTGGLARQTLEPSDEQRRSGRSGLVPRQTTAAALVSNMGQTNGEGAPFSWDFHQPFTTGDNTAGYTITQIELDVGTVGNNARVPSLSIHTLSGTSLGTKVGDLTSPSGITTDGELAWTSTGIDLAARTTYTVHINQSGSGTTGRFHDTASGDEDSDAASGWSIRNDKFGKTFNTGGNSWFHSSRTIQIRITGTAKTVTATVPDAPTGLTASASGATQIDLSWTAPANDGGESISGYKVEVSADGNAWADLVDSQVATSYSHTGLTAGSTRHYRVSAINSVGAGAVSAVASATTASSDAILSALTVSPKDIFGFSSSRDSYEVGVAAAVTRATVTATAAESGATVTYSGTDVDTTTPGHQVDLTAGRNAVTVTVTAQDTTTTKEYTVSVNRGVTTEYGWKASEDLDGLIGNVEPTGVWSDGTTIWVADTFADNLFAVKASDKTRDSSKDFDLAADNSRPAGIWSDGTTMWVADRGDDKLYAYDMATKAYDSSKDFGLAADNASPRDVWSDETTMWVADSDDDKLYAYDMATKAYDSSKDFGLAADNTFPQGIWSDETTMWVADSGDDKIYAYKMSDKTYVSERDFDTLDGAGNNTPTGIWSDGTTMWATDVGDFKAYSYNLPVYPASASVTGASLTITFSQDLASAPGLANSAFAVKKTPDGGSEGTVALSGTPVVSGKTVTLTLASAVAATDTDVKVSYTVPSTGRLANLGGNEVTGFADLVVASTDASLSSLSVNDVGVAGFAAATTSYQVIVAGSVETATVAAAATHSGASVVITPDDADTTTDGHQVDLSVGRNAVTVTVTAQDGATTEAYTVSVDRGVADEYGWNPYEDLSIDLFSLGNGIWSDGTTVWIADRSSRTLAAFSVSTEARVSSRDFSLAEDNSFPQGIWSDGTTMWVADVGEDKLFAYSMSTKAHDSSRDFDLAAGNTSPVGAWSDGTTMWVVDSDSDKIFAYDMSTKAHDSSKDFNTLGGARNNAPRGIWSDGTTMWVADWTDGKLYAYNIATKARVGSRDFDKLKGAGNARPSGVWSDGTTLWTADGEDDKLYSYNVPVYPASALVSGTTLTITFSQDLAAAPGLANSAFAVEKTPDGGAEGTVALSGSPVVSGRTVTLTLAAAVAATDTDIKVSYTVPSTATSRLANTGGTEVTSFTDLAVRMPSSDATLSALSVNGVGVAGFSAATTTGYQAGVASTVASPTVAATPTHSGASVDYSGTDADSNTDGHQVALSAGRNAVTVTVTAEDGTTTKEYTVSVNRGVATEYGWKAGEDLDGLAAADNRDPRGVWSDGTTMWVSDQTDDKMYAYKVSDKTRDSSKDFALAADNDRPVGVWSDRTTMWVADNSDDKMYAYKMSDKTRDSSKDFALAADNNNPTGVWSDGTTMWVADHDDEKLYAYKMSNKARDAGRDFDTLDAAGNSAPRGIWSDGITMWVAEAGLAKVYAYKMSNKARDSGRDFDTLAAAGNNDPYGVWSDGTTMWVSDWRDDDKLYAYNLPVYAVSALVSGTSLTIAFSQDLAAAPGLANSAFAVKKTPDGGSEGTVALSGSPVVSGKTVTLTLATAVAATDTDIKVSYTVPSTATSRLANLGGTEVTSFTDLAVSIASSDATLSALSVNGVGVAGFAAATTGYQAGVASTVASATVAATPTHSGASVSFMPAVDADSNADGHQVALSAGRNAVTVTVTAEDTTTTETYTVSVNRGVTADYGWKASEDFDGLVAAGNESPADVWSDGTTVWVTDDGDDKVYAYKASDKTRDDSEDFDLAPGNDNPGGIWSDGTTMWVVDPISDKIFAYEMSGKTRDVSEDFGTLDADNRNAFGIWSDGITMWVSDRNQDQIFAYEMSTKARVPGRDFGALAAENTQSYDIWSDGSTMWVADLTDTKLYAYDMATKVYVGARDFGTLIGAGNTGSVGLWSDGSTMWVTDFFGGKVFSYNLPVYVASVSVIGTTLEATFSQDLDAVSGLANSAFGVKKTPDGGAETTVALSGSPVVSGNTVTLTLTTAVATGDSGYKLSYTKPAAVASRLANMAGREVTGFTDMAFALSADTSLSALTVNGAGVSGLSADRTSYEFGVAATTATVTVAATATHPEAAAVISSPADAGAAVGHQVGLSAGRNAVTVTVTAQDGSTEDHTVSVNRGVTTEYGWKAVEDFDTLIAAGQDVVEGVWSNGTTMWVANLIDDKLYAYNMSDKTRDESEDFDTLNAASNNLPEGIWSDGITMWVTDQSDSKLYAYKLSDKARDSSKDFDTLNGAGNEFPADIWSDGTTMWVLDFISDKIYAYDMATKAYDGSKDFARSTLRGAGNANPAGIWSDDTTMWVADWRDNKLYAYDMATKAYDSSRDFDTLTGAGNDGESAGLWSDGTTMWVPDSDFANSKVYSYNLPVYAVSAAATGTTLEVTFSQDLASVTGLGNSAFTVKKTTGSTESAVTLTGTPAISGKTVTLTLATALTSADTDVKVSYTVPATATSRLANGGGNQVASFEDLAVILPSSDATLSALSVNGVGVAGFSAATTGYQAGVAAAVASATVTATPNHSGATVSFMPAVDADSNADGHQVALSAGRNAVTVTVTAEDTTTTEEYTVSVNRGVTADYGWKASEDFDGLSAFGNELPAGVWSDGATMWVTDGGDGKLYAYNVSDKTRASSEDFDTLAGAGNERPAAIWSDGTTMWVTDDRDDKIYAYRMSDKAYDSSKDFDTLEAAGNRDPLGIWSDETTMWVSDISDSKVYAYEMSTKARDSSKDFDTLEAAGNERPFGIWSDGTTMWVVDPIDNKVYAYKMSDKAYESDRDFDTLAGAGNNDSTGAWSDGTTMWVADRVGKVFSYNLAVYVASVSVIGTTLEVEFSQDLAAVSGLGNSAFGVKKTPDGGAEAAVALSGSPVVSGNTVTLTLSAAVATGDSGYKLSYTKPAAAASRLANMAGREVTGFTDMAFALSGDTSLSSLTVNGAGVSGLSADRTAYEFGVAATTASVAVAATATHPEAAAVISSPADADAAVGHQVGLSAGRNEVTVTVTAQDGSTEDHTVSVNRGVTAEYGWKAVEDFDTLIAAGHERATGLWSNGTTMWVVHRSDDDGDKIFAYNMSDKTRDDSKDFDLAEDNTAPEAIWSDETTMWVVDQVDEKIYAYKMSDKTRDDSKDFDTLTAAGHYAPSGLWSDGNTMWVSDFVRDKIFAYDMSTKAHDGSKDFAFSAFSGAGNRNPTDIWSDGITMWVADHGDDKVYAYKMSDKTYDSSKDFDTLAAAGHLLARGVWSDGNTMWVSDSDEDISKVFSYNLPVYAASAAVNGASLVVTFSQDLAAASPASSAFGVKKTTGSTESAVSLSGSPVVSGKTVTLTLATALTSADTDTGGPAEHSSDGATPAPAPASRARTPTPSRCGPAAIPATTGAPGPISQPCRARPETPAPRGITPTSRPPTAATQNYAYGPTTPTTAQPQQACPPPPHTGGCHAARANKPCTAHGEQHTRKHRRVARARFHNSPGPPLLPFGPDDLDLVLIEHRIRSQQRNADFLCLRDKQTIERVAVLHGESPCMQRV